MQVRIWLGQLAAADGVEGQRGAGCVSASVSSSMKPARSSRRRGRAPQRASSASCSGLRTMFTSANLSARCRAGCSIWPRLEAAAVCTSAVWFSIRIVSTMPSAVSGLTNRTRLRPPSCPGGSSRHSAAFTAAVLRVHRAAGRGDGLAQQRLRRRRRRRPPRPSPAPFVADRHRRADARRPAPRMRRIGDRRGDHRARPAMPAEAAAAKSARPRSRPRSDGLSGAASTRISTSFGPGSGTGTVSRNSSSVWSALTSDRSWSASAGICTDIGAILSERPVCPGS